MYLDCRSAGEGGRTSILFLAPLTLVPVLLTATEGQTFTRVITFTPHTAGDVGITHFILQTEPQKDEASCQTLKLKN